jgi:hypothetical protein
LVALAEALIEHETLDAVEIEQIIETGKLTPVVSGSSSGGAVPVKHSMIETSTNESAVIPPPDVGQAPAHA